MMSSYDANPILFNKNINPFLPRPPISNKISFLPYPPTIPTPPFPPQSGRHMCIIPKEIE